MTKPIRYLAYARKSSSGDGKQVESIPDQERILKELVTREDLIVVDYLAEARSATKPGLRSVFTDMLRRISCGEAEGILVWHVNRLARNDREWGELKQLLHDGTIQCIKTPERQYLPEDHALLISVEAAMATQYTRDLRRDVKRGTAEKVKRGWYPFRPKQGYVVDPFTHEVLPDPERFPLLRTACEQFLTGSYSVPQALATLNARGYRTPRFRGGGNTHHAAATQHRRPHIHKQAQAIL